MLHGRHARARPVVPIVESVVPTPTTGHRFRTSRVVVVPLPYSRSKTFRVFFFFLLRFLFLLSDEKARARIFFFPFMYRKTLNSNYASLSHLPEREKSVSSRGFSLKSSLRTRPCPFSLTGSHFSTIESIYISKTKPLSRELSCHYLESSTSLCNALHCP